MAQTLILLGFTRGTLDILTYSVKSFGLAINGKFFNDFNDIHGRTAGLERVISSMISRGLLGPLGRSHGR